MHVEFKLLMDKGDSLDAPGFLEEEIDRFLNMSQDRFVSKRAFGNNPRRTSFEEDQKRRDDLRTLIVEFSDSSFTVTSANKPNGVFIQLPSDYRHAINEETILQDKELKEHRVGVKPITHDRYNKIIDDPFNKPKKTSAYRLDYGSFDTNEYFEIITGDNITLLQYFLRYIKEPPQIGVDQDCILADHTHREIVRMAVLDSLENVEQPRYQSSKIELNEIE